jgi:hypothetical protein
MEKLTCNSIAKGTQKLLGRGEMYDWTGVAPHHNTGVNAIFEPWRIAVSKGT